MEQKLTKKDFIGLDIVMWALSHIAKHRTKKEGIEYKITSVSFDSKPEEHSDDGVPETLCLHDIIMGSIIGIGMRIMKKDRVYCSIER